jgi:hypothetical protein
LQLRSVLSSLSICESKSTLSALTRTSGTTSDSTCSNVVELTILVEEEFVNREFEDATGEIEFVGDLIHHIEVYQPGSSQDHIPLGLDSWK